jgi:hypothetical protein
MSKRTIFADGCDIAVYNSQGHLLMEYNDVSREIAVDTLNTLQQLILNEDNRRRAKEKVNDTDLFDRLDEEFNIRAKKLLPKPIHNNTEKVR